MRSTIPMALAAVLLAVAPSAARAQQAVVGIASVIDGDTLDIHGQRIRLHGIDAPESAQLCLDGAGRELRCGQKAALALADKVERRTVRCEEKDVDRHSWTATDASSRR